MFLRVLLDKGFSVGVSLIIVSVVAIILSWFLHLFIEKPSQKLGRKLATELKLNSLLLNLFTRKRIKPIKLNQLQ